MENMLVCYSIKCNWQASSDPGISWGRVPRRACSMATAVYEN